MNRPMSNLIDQFERTALLSREKQDDLFRFLGEHTVELDFEAGIARFSSGIEAPFQAIGTESDNTLTWLWAWADEQAELPDQLLRSARDLKAWGAQHGVTEFTLPSVDLNVADGNMIALIASDVCRATGYYRDAYEGGALFILLSGPQPGRHADLDRAGISRQLQDMISRYDFDHRKALLSYLRARGIPLSETGDAVSAELPSGERIIAEFDRKGQLRTINGEAVT